MRYLNKQGQQASSKISKHPDEVRVQDVTVQVKNDDLFGVQAQQVALVEKLIAGKLVKQAFIDQGCQALGQLVRFSFFIICIALVLIIERKFLRTENPHLKGARCTRIRIFLLRL